MAHEDQEAVVEQVPALVELAACTGDRITVRVPGTEYFLDLYLPDGMAPPAAVGRRIRGVIQGKALRMHAHAGGGLFIEPLVGEPRIVSGRVRGIDRAAGVILLDVGVPMQLACLPGQDLRNLEVGGMASCHVKSRMLFTPIAS